MTAKRIKKTDRFKSVTGFILRLSLIINVIILGMLFGGCSSTKLESGVAEYKNIIGVMAGKDKTVIQIRINRVAIGDQTFVDIFPEPSDTMVITQANEEGMKQVYSEIKYKIDFKMSSTDEKASYYISRDNFNKVRLGEITKFEIDKTNGEWIGKIFE